MWHNLHVDSYTDPIDRDLVLEVLEASFRTLISSLMVASLAWLLLSGFLQTDEFNMRVSLVVLTIFVNGIAVLKLLDTQSISAYIVWQLGLLGTAALAIDLFREPRLVFFMAFSPLMATVLLGWPAGVGAEVLLALIVLGVFPASRVPAFRLDPNLQAVVLVGGGFGALLGIVITQTLFRIALRALKESQRTRKRMEIAFDQQLELKQTQEDLIQANKELARLSNRLRVVSHVAEEARQAKQQFVANVSHELRTPLNMIIGFSEMIPQLSEVYGADLPPALLSDIDAIRRNSQHLSKLVDDVLDLSQMEVDRMALTKGWCSLEDTLEEAITAVRVLYESKDLYLHLNVAPDIPQIYCDATRIRQVILNLLSNAGRFTQEGGVTIEAVRRGKYVQVCVKDTGPGIEEEKLDRLFEPFEQLDGSIQQRYGGSGLGLSISKRFVERHEGSMLVNSKPGEGTSFCFTIPIHAPLSPSLDEEDARRWFNPYESTEFKIRTRRSRAPKPEIVPRYVLLDNGQALQRLFNHYVSDVDLEEVQSIDEVVTLLQRSPAQAVVANLSSYEDQDQKRLIRNLNDLPDRTPTITCWVPGFNVAARRLGVSQYLLKPVTRDALLQALKDLGRPVETVLLVDDEPEALRLFARMLSTAPEGYRILQTNRGSRALSLLEERRPDAVLLDLIMPGIDGFEVIKRKNQDPALVDIPVIVISSRDPTGDPIVSDTLSVARGGGLSGQDLMMCVRAVSQILSLGGTSGDRERRESSPDPVASGQIR